MQKFLRHFFITAFLFCLTQLVNAQESSSVTKGQILTTDHKTASFVTITLKQNGKQTSADANGFFEIDNLPSLQDSIIISAIGVQSYSIAINLSNHQTLDIGTIQVKAATNILQDVEITGRKTQSYKSDYTFSALKIQTSLSKTPQSVSTVTKELMKDKMVFNLKDALQTVAGANQYSGYDEFTLRGFRAENPHLINGLRSYNTTLITPLLVNIERIEIIKGPASVLYGNADPGGTINLVTKKPLANKEFNIDLYNGSWNNFRAQADVTGPLNNSKNLLYRLNAGYNNSKSFRDNYFNKAFQIAPSVSFISNNKIQLNADFSLSHTNTIADRGQPGILNDNNLNNTPINLSANQPGDYLKETNIASIISFSYKINSHITFNSAYLNYITEQRLAEHGIKDYITPDSVDLYYTNKKFNTTTNTISNFATFSFNTGAFQHEFLAGYDFIRSNVSLNVFNGELPDEFGEGSGIVGTFSLLHPQYLKPQIANYKQSDEESDEDADAYTTQGLYFQEQLNYKKWSLLFGLRGEFYKAEDGDDDTSNTQDAEENVLLPRIALTYALTPTINIYATYNKGFDPFEASITQQVFNEAAKPIYSSLYEAGFKADVLKDRLSATFSIYQLTLKNVAVNASDPSNPDLYVQRGKEQSTGFETELNGNITSNLSISFSYAHNIAKVKDSKMSSEVGMIKENAPKNISGSWIKYTFKKGSFKNLSLAAGHSQVGERNTLTSTLQLPAYCIFDAGASYSFKNFRIGLNVLNLANKTYWTSAYNYSSKWPGAPRNYMINLSYNLHK